MGLLEHRPLAGLFAATILAGAATGSAAEGCSPVHVVYAPDGARLYAADSAARRVATVDSSTGAVLSTLELGGDPVSLAVDASTRRVYVSERDTATVAELIPSGGDGKSAAGLVAGRSFRVGVGPEGLAIATQRRMLLAVNGLDGTVSAIDLESGRELQRIAAGREPRVVAIDRSESLAAVGGILPEQASAGSIHFIDLGRLAEVAAVPLLAGSTCVRGLAFSPDGQWLYAAHVLHRPGGYHGDVRFLAEGAVSIVDCGRRKLYACLLLSTFLDGAPEPWGAALTDGGKTLWTCLSGSDRLARLDLARLHPLLEGKVPPSLQYPPDDEQDPENAWYFVHESPSRRLELAIDRKAMARAQALQHRPAGAKGPRGLALSPSGERLAVAGYFSGSISFFDAASGDARAAPLGSPGTALAQRGEALFHDASLSLETRLSCATCHPDGRTSGLRWTLSEGADSAPMRTPSLLGWGARSSDAGRKPAGESAPAAPPGPSLEQEVERSFRVFHFRSDPEALKAVVAYLRTLQPRRGRGPDEPARAQRIQRGKALFEGKAACAGCHAGAGFTDGRLHDVGTSQPAAGDRDRLVPTEAPGDARPGSVPRQQFATPSLLELRSRGPYLHDGRAGTLGDIFQRDDPTGRHGSARSLTEEELRDLLEYLSNI